MSGHSTCNNAGEREIQKYGQHAMRVILSFWISFIAGYTSLYAQNTYALIIGVSEYREEGITDLNYAHRDAELFANFLMSPAGGNIPRSNIKLLTQTNATVSNIYTELQWIERTVKQGDRVYFYFSGHGDIDNTVHKIGYLLAYDTPKKNYLRNALRIEDINNLANTLSLTRDVELILITDACHSGNLSERDNKGRAFVGDQLAKSVKNEIRISSCEPDQKSWEDAAWGGGRGAFSYHLINGLTGMAEDDDDDSSEGAVTLEELNFYLSKKVSRDVRKIKNEEQRPIIDGDLSKPIAFIDEDALSELKNNIERAENGTVGVGDKSLEFVPTDFNRYFEAIDQRNLKNNFNFDTLQFLSKEKIVPFFLHETRFYIWDFDDPGFLDSIVSVPELRYEYEQRLASSIHNDVQKAINGYLQATKEETEKRQYYYSKNSNFGEYASMLRTAMKLIDSTTYMFTTMQVKELYFTGVNAKLEMQHKPNTDSLYQIALNAQLQALQLEPRAPYVLNELGDLAFSRMNDEEALKYYQQAIELAPDWTIALANLSKVHYYLFDLEKSMDYARQTIEVNPDFDLGYFFLGLNYFDKRNYLFAEENFLKTIRRNENHYYPYELLGELYTYLGDYTKADQFYGEAELRKQFLLQKPIYRKAMDATGMPLFMELYQFSPIDSTLFGPDDFMAHGILAHNYYEQRNYNAAEFHYKKAIQINPEDPVLYKYLGELMMERERWMEADLYFEFAEQNFLELKDFKKYVRKKSKTQQYLEFDIKDLYEGMHYRLAENKFIQGYIFDSWGYPKKALNIYKEIYFKGSEEDKFPAFLLIIELLEKINLYFEAEDIIEHYAQTDSVLSRTKLRLNYLHYAENNINPGLHYYKAGDLLYEMIFELKKLDYHETISYGFYDDPNIIVIPGTDAEIYNKGWILWEENKLNSLLLEGINAFEHAVKYLSDTSTLAEGYFKTGLMYEKLAINTNSITYEDEAEKNFQKAKNLMPTGDHSKKLIERSKQNSNYSNAYAEYNDLSTKNKLEFKDRLDYYELQIKANDPNFNLTLLDTMDYIYPVYLPEYKELKALYYVMTEDMDNAIDLYISLAGSSTLSQTADINYTISRLLSVMGNNAEAGKYLNKAIDLGFSHTWVLDKDPYLENMRTLEDWATIRDKLPASKIHFKDRDFDSNTYWIEISRR